MTDIVERIVERLRMTANCGIPDFTNSKLLDEAADEIERMEKSLRDIEAWARAYPLTVFPKPDLKRAAQVLEEHGMTLDAISADAMRHVLDGIIYLVRDGLGTQKKAAP